jgi:hypothetical protein
MEQLDIILFLSGFAIAMISLTIMMTKAVRGKKIGIVIPFITIIGLASLGTGIWLKIQNKDSINAVVANKFHTTVINAVNNSKETNKIKDAIFDPNGSILPKESMDMWGNKTIIDADGSKTFGGLIFTTEGIRYHKTDSAVVAIPDSHKYPDGKHYKEYTYSINNLDGTIYVTESSIVTKDETHTDQDKALKEKLERYPPNSGYEMNYIDFIYKYIPISKPKNTIKNDFLSGNYVGKEEEILKTNTTISINILDDKILDFKCSYISGIDSTYGYKIESLGKNAYKLYLYPATIKADTNDGGTTIADEPIKRTFIIYMKSKDSFDIVFTTDDIKRVSINMNKI